MKLNKEQLEKSILGIILGIIALVLLMTLVFGPNLKKISRLRGQIREQSGKAANAEREVSDLARLRLSLKGLEGRVGQYKKDMPLATPDWLLERLNILAGETEIDFDKIEPRGYITQAGLYWLQGLHIELKTDYHKLGRFINKLENLSPFIKVIDLSIVSNKDNINKHVVKLTVGTYVEEK